MAAVKKFRDRTHGNNRRADKDVSTGADLSRAKAELRVTESITDIEDAECEDRFNSLMTRLRDNIWGYNKKGQLALKGSMQMMSSKRGMYCRIPIFCKGEKCPYAQSCITLAEGLAPEGQPCPTEVALITKKLARYANEFELDKIDSPTDEALVEELITMEIQMERCKSLMSQEITPIQNMVVGIADNGEAVIQPQVSKTIEAYERFSKKRNADYNLLMATRRDKNSIKKKEENTEQRDVFSIVEQAQQMEDFYDIEKRPDGIEDATVVGNKNK